MKPWLLPAVTAFLCWGVWAFLPKLTTRYLEPRSAIVYEVAGGLVVALAVLVWMGFRVQHDVRGVSLALLTGMVGTCGALAYLFAVTRGPVSLISMITAMYPVIAVLLAILLLGESLTLKQGVGVVLALVALVLIAG